MMNRRTFGAAMVLPVLSMAAGCAGVTGKSRRESLIAPGAGLVTLPEKFGFAEGPVADSHGDVYFADYPKNRVCRLDTDGVYSVFMEDVPGPVGMDIDRDGNLVVASTTRRAIISIDMKSGRQTILAERYRGKPLNSPNDLWCDPRGGVYFSDPRFVQLPESMEQDRMAVYYIPPDRSEPIRVIGDMEKPNGILGSPDGSRLFVNDTGRDETYVYRVNPDGTLSGRKRFAKEGFDGMCLDREGNLYITSKGLEIYSPSGEKIEHIDIPNRPTNLCFGGSDRRTLVITSIPKVYTLRMRVAGAER